MISISFSWDDGAIEDLKLMDLSLKFNMPSIFFIPATNPERRVLSKDNIKTLAKNSFEIGSHTYSHSYLTNLLPDRAEEEMLKGKDFLEQLLGKDIPHFCFPGGKFNSDHVKVSKKYFSSARTADTGALIGEDPFLIKPTFHFYDRGRISLLYNSIKNLSPILFSLLKNFSKSDYYQLLIRLIDDLNKRSSLSRIMIWGHSWEIERYNLWSRLEFLFRHISDNYSVNILNYSDLLTSVNVKKASHQV